jgi:hypothetical protein
MGIGVKHVRLLAICGLLGGILALIAILLEGDTYGFPPGSAAYQLYEAFNRFIAVFLVLQTCSFSAFYITQNEMLGKSGRRLTKLALVAWIAMAIGTAAEFWLFSNLPYPNSPADFNMRTVAFALFFFGSLAAGIVLLVLGLRLFRNGGLRRLLSATLILYLPLFVTAFYSSFSIFIAPAVTSIGIAAFALKSSSGSKSSIIG